MLTTKMKEEKFLSCKRLMKILYPIAFDEFPSISDSDNELDYYLKYFFISGNLKRKENYNFKCRTLLCFIISYIVYAIFQSKFFRKKMINNVIYFQIQKNRIVLQTTKMGLKIVLFVYFWLYWLYQNFCISMYFHQNTSIRISINKKLKVFWLYTERNAWDLPAIWI